MMMGALWTSHRHHRRRRGAGPRGGHYRPGHRQTRYPRHRAGWERLSSETLFRNRAPLGVADAVSRIPGGGKNSGISPWGADIWRFGASTGTGWWCSSTAAGSTRPRTSTGRLGLVNPADIQRIEVLKGPVSELYGSGSHRRGGQHHHEKRRPSSRVAQVGDSALYRHL